MVLLGVLSHLQHRNVHTVNTVCEVLQETVNFYESKKSGGSSQSQS